MRHVAISATENAEGRVTSVIIAANEIRIIITNGAIQSRTG